MSPADFEGKTVLITCGSAGIGKAASLEFAGRGAVVIMVGRNRATGAAALTEIEAVGGVAQFVPADVTTTAGREQLVAHSGPVDVLVNGAGYRPPIGWPRT